MNAKSKTKVLIADDSKYVRRLISNILQEFKQIEVLDYATNGEEALEMVNFYNPDILLLDLIMPKKNGLDVLKEIMNQYPTPTIILSALNPKDMDSSMQALLMGAIDYIIKPGGMDKEALPKFKNTLVKKVINAANSQVNKIYKKSQTDKNNNSYLRQKQIDEVFQFGKYLNTLGSSDSKKKVDSSSLQIKSTEFVKSESRNKSQKPISTKNREINKRTDIISHSDISKKPTPHKKAKKVFRKDLDYIRKEKVKIKPHATKINETYQENLNEIIDHQDESSFTPQIKKKSLKEIKKVIEKEADSSSILNTQPINDVIIDSNVIVIGASVGGPKTIISILKDVPSTLQAPILIVQHLNFELLHTFTKTLDGITGLKVKIGEHGEFLKKGFVYISPSNQHMEISVKKGKPCIRIFDAAPVNFSKPSIDILFASAARTYKDKTLGILLTGMGRDGVEGLGAIKKYRGRTVAESKETAILYGIPKVATKMGYAKYILPNYKISNFIVTYGN
ncbi:MAG: response regulator [Candidatus Lokiarchaeota archaeon]|nr:response regulator [Candidatus Lokiarchaeota archaeon]MBD3198650.1 response regulator [Candidatus Lokiarchaeota archaeon]